MLNMIKADLFRILKGKGIYVMIIILVGIAILSSYSLTPLSMGLNIGSGDATYGLDEEHLEEFNKITTIGETRELLLNYGDYELDSAIIAKNNSMYYFFIAIVVMVLCCDFSNNTIKNTISTNISKKKYYFSKLILAMILGTMFIFLNTYINYFINLLMNGSAFSSSLSNVTILTIQELPLLLSLISILVMIAVLVRKTAIFNSITIPFLMVAQLIIFGVVNFLNLPNKILDFEFEMALGNLCNNPTTTYMIEVFGFWIIIFVITTLIGYNSFKKRDI